MDSTMTNATVAAVADGEAFAANSKAHSTRAEHGQVVHFLYPPTESVKGRALGALLRGEKLTVLDGWRRFGSSTLTQHVKALRDAGWPIQTVQETVGTSDAGRAATIGIYFLPADVIQQIGAAGVEFAAECAQIEAERRRA